MNIEDITPNTVIKPPYVIFYGSNGEPNRVCTAEHPWELLSAVIDDICVNQMMSNCKNCPYHRASFENSEGDKRVFCDWSKCAYTLNNDDMHTFARHIELYSRRRMRIVLDDTDAPPFVVY